MLYLTGIALGSFVHAVLSDSSRKVHVQALARNRRPEALAEDVVQLKEMLIKSKEETKIAQVQARRLESELLKSRSSLLKSEEVIHNKERMTSATQGISQLYRSPDTTHLVGNLKEQNRDLRAARDSMADELQTIRKSMKATRMAELQSEVFTTQIEMERLIEINRVRERSHALVSRFITLQTHLCLPWFIIDNDSVCLPASPTTAPLNWP